MENKPKAYIELIESLCDTEGVNYYSKEDFSNDSQRWRKTDERYANLLEILAPIFNSLNEEQKKAFGDWNEYMYQRGIEFTLAVLESADNLTLAIKENNEIREVLPKPHYNKDFWNYLKKVRSYS